MHNVASRFKMLTTPSFRVLYEQRKSVREIALRYQRSEKSTEDEGSCFAI